jgi:carbon storage regulator CsrA
MGKPLNTKSLVLTRKLDQSIVLADGMIRITPIRFRGNQVVLMVDAPGDIRVDREEVHQKITKGAKP